MNSRSELLHALDDVDQRLLALIGTLAEDELSVPMEPGINPPVWELGHAAFFYEVFVLRALDESSPAMPGYDEIWDSFEIKHSERWREGVVPDKSTTVDYYRRIMDAVRARIAAGEPSPDELYLYKYAIHHHHMHVESLIWCRQTLAQPAPPSCSATSAQWAQGGAEAAQKQGDAHIPGGRYRIGLPARTEGNDDFATSHFGFDAEKPGFEIDVEPFAIAKTLVSNREFVEFVEAGMYEDPDVWAYGGRNWLRDTGASHPVYWQRDTEGRWLVRLFDKWKPLVANAPVMHISFWEADAYARWRGRRLPTEFEWEAAARGPEALLFPWGNVPADAEKVDMDGTFFGQQSVTAYPTGASPFGCLQMLGSAWEWTSSQFLPYPGFVTDMYPYMSTLQFGDHKVTKGGSCATSSCLMRNTYRQAYHPDRRDVYTGLRTCAL